MLRASQNYRKPRPHTSSPSPSARHRNTNTGRFFHPSKSSPRNRSDQASSWVRRILCHRLVITFFLSVVSFHGGRIVAENTTVEVPPCVTLGKKQKEPLGRGTKQKEKMDAVEMEDRIAEEVKKKVEEARDKHKSPKPPPPRTPLKLRSSTIQTEWPYLPPSLHRVAVALAVTPRKIFLSTYDYGTPPEPLANNGNEDVLILYTNAAAIPSTYETKVGPSGTGLIPQLKTLEATEKCGTMDVVFMNKENDSQRCWAVFENYQNQFVQRWVVDKKKTTKHETSGIPKTFVQLGRGVSNNGMSNQFPVPLPYQILDSQTVFKRYLNSVDDVLTKLKPLVESVARPVKQPPSPNDHLYDQWGGTHSVVVMTANYGHSDLLINFVCSMRAKGMADVLGNVLVFATDKKSESVAKSLGLTTFYDEVNFHHLPEREAKAYGDERFANMMYAKAVSVQLVTMLGYDVLFQDVDIVWYRNPLPYLQTLLEPSNPKSRYDIIFQDDGNRGQQFSEAYGNSGFYYVRSNALTKYLLTCVLYEGAAMRAWRSHQSVLMAKVAEHASAFGLRVKVLDAEKDFPCGKQYHRKGATTMKAMTKGIKGENGKKTKLEPYVFHMSWTENKTNKILFMKQMGMWYTEPVCMEEKVLEGSAGGVEACCAADALISCHYRDKPSVVPCVESMPIDRGRKSFW